MTGKLRPALPLSRSGQVAVDLDRRDRLLERQVVEVDALDLHGRRQAELEAVEELEGEPRVDEHGDAEEAEHRDLAIEVDQFLGLAVDVEDRDPAHRHAGVAGALLRRVGPPITRPSPSW
ncbi:MAG: hypothetical protein E6J91_32890 [Deltaproteobacteria bacterium]|nr:MAG: hypothetical protein E6J91_32890 [Deltaproteobacteria bacterium]